MPVLAIEPSGEMLRQRPPGAARAVQAAAEALPLRDGAVDAALAVLMASGTSCATRSTPCVSHTPGTDVGRWKNPRMSPDPKAVN